MNPPRRQPPDVRREQILDAAQQVLLRRGPDAATMAEVADAASLAKGTVYLYFESKAELLAGLRARYFERLTAVLADPPGARRGAPPTAAARIEGLVAAFYDFAHANGFPASAYASFLGFRSASYDVSWVDTLGMDPRHPPTEGWPRES